MQSLSFQPVSGLPIEGFGNRAAGSTIGLIGSRVVGPRQTAATQVAEAVGIKELRIHDLRHFTASTFTAEGVADNIISLLTGHKSHELRRYPFRA
jgi:integrase